MSKNIGIVLAGGIGNRIGLETPKQFLRIAGKPVIQYSLETFSTHKKINSLIIVVHKDYKKTVENIIKLMPKIKPYKIVSGGETRNDSTKAALKVATGDNDKLIFHDAARPFLNHKIIDDCIKYLEKYNAVDVCIHSADTLVEVNKKGEIKNMPVRENFRRGQTPQAFKAKTIKEAYRLFNQDKHKVKVTDDCGIVFNYFPDEKIKTISGSEENIKITVPIDLHIADKLFQIKTETHQSFRKSTYSFKNKNVVIFGGTSGIGKGLSVALKKEGANVLSLSRKDGIDVSKTEGIKKSFEIIKSKFKKIDIIIITAGILKIEKLSKMSDMEIVNQISTNLISNMLIAKHAYKELKKTKGRMLVYSSSSYTRGRANYSLYSAAKAGVVNMTQAISEEWHKDGIKINCIVPARTDTPMRTKAFGEEPKHTLLSVAEVVDVSKNVLSSVMTGQVIDIKVSR